MVEAIQNMMRNGTESARDTLDTFFTRLEALINRQHMDQMENPVPHEPGSDDHSALFESYSKMISLEKEMQVLYNEPSVSPDELQKVEGELNSIEAMLPAAA